MSPGPAGSVTVPDDTAERVAAELAQRCPRCTGTGRVGRRPWSRGDSAVAGRRARTAGGTDSPAPTAGVRRGRGGAPAELAAARAASAGRVLVLGTEELMYLPLRLGAGARRPAGQTHSNRRPGPRCTRSTRPGYPIRRRIDFRASDDPGADRGAERHVYNAGWPDAVNRSRRGRPGAWWSTTGTRSPVPTGSPAGSPRDRGTVLPSCWPRPTAVSVDGRRAAAGRPASCRSRCAGRRSAATGPTRSAWLLTDLSGLDLEADVARAGGRDPGRPGALRGVAADRVPARPGLPGAVRRGAGRHARPARAAPSARSPNWCWPSAGPTWCWRRWPGPARRSAS